MALFAFNPFDMIWELLGPNLFSIAKDVHDWSSTLNYYIDFESEHSHPYFISNNFTEFVLKFIQVTLWCFSSLCFLKSFPFLIFAHQHSILLHDFCPYFCFFLLEHKLLFFLDNYCTVFLTTVIAYCLPSMPVMSALVFCLRIILQAFSLIVSCFHLHFNSFVRFGVFVGFFFLFIFWMSKYLEFANGEVTFEEILEPSRHHKCSPVLIGKRLMWSCAILLQYHIILEHFAPASNFLQEKKITLNSRCPN